MRRFDLVPDVSMLMRGSGRWRKVKRGEESSVVWPFILRWEGVLGCGGGVGVLGGSKRKAFVIKS